MRMTINEIILNELNAEIDSIIKYKTDAASGLIDYEHPILTDTEILNHLEAVCQYYKTKIV